MTFETQLIVGAGTSIRSEGGYEFHDQDALQILELQPAGKKRMTAEEFLRGYPIGDGCRFGPERLA